MKRVEQHASKRVPAGACASRLLLGALLLHGAASVARGVEERSSNGIGGGRWSDPRAWHGGVVPTASNRVVISGADTIHFDAVERNAPHCAGLSIDPNGVLAFRMDGRTNALVVNGAVNVYGTIRADATRDAESRAGLRLVAEASQDRVINLLRGSALLLYGASVETPNIELTAALGSDASGGRITADGDAMIDLQRVGFSAIQIQASRLDNTGYKSNQRINVIACSFTNGASVRLAFCDTAVIKDNLFRFGNPAARVAAAITLARCSLSACRGNRIGGYATAIDLAHEIDVSVLDNRLSDVQHGIIARHCRNGMIKGNSVSNAVTAVLLESTSGVVEDLLVQGAQKGVWAQDSNLQITDYIARGMAVDGIPLYLRSASVTLLNGNVTVKDIRLDGKRPPAGFWVQNMNYLVVRLTGKVPPQATIQVATAAVSGGVPKGGGADLNVRNSPASTGPSGWSPLPATMRPLIVRSWSIRANEEVVDPPFYDLTVSGFLPDGTPNPKPLHTRVIEPRDDWFRPDPNAALATLEIKL